MREKELLRQVADLKDDVEERDHKIERLTTLVAFLSAEVRIYTQSLEDQVSAQKTEIELLKAAKTRNN